VPCLVTSASHPVISVFPVASSSSTKPELCDNSTGHSQEQLSRDSPSDFRSLFLLASSCLSSAKPEVCHKSTGHIREQPSSDAPSEFRLLFSLSLLLHRLSQSFVTSRLDIIGSYFLGTYPTISACPFCLWLALLSLSLTLSLVTLGDSTN
jgi:hypothetical protein